MSTNYQVELEKILKKNESGGENKALLLHSCCAPCSSYVLEYLAQYFQITVFYYNPNIDPLEEYQKRVLEQKELIRRLPVPEPIRFIEGRFEKEKFYAIAKGYEEEPEGGVRCQHCYELRLRKTGALAKQLGFDYFTTTLTISPLKNAADINEIGQALEKEYSVAYLPSDFKKKNGYLRSLELSKEYNLYRQDYCGCIYSHSAKNIKQKER